MKEYSSGRREGIVDGRKKSGRRKSNIRHDSIDSVKMAIEIDPFLSIKRISKNLDLSHAMVQRIMKDDLGKKSVNAKFFPHDLTIKNKKDRVAEARKIINALESRRIDQRLIVTDEKWLYETPLGCRATRTAWVDGAGDRPKIPRRTISDKKHLVCVAVTLAGSYYHEVLEVGESMNSQRYLIFLNNMFRAFQRFYPSFIISDFILMHDNARPHVAETIISHVNRNQYKLLKQAPYSPDTNLCDRLVFPAMEMKRSHTLLLGKNAVNTFISEFLADFSITGFFNAKQALLRDLHKIVENDGEYLKNPNFV